ncbi:hypothetical protein [Actinomadura bangladeshensis]|uniref:Uncharacterized protein n=1 Tax=Actinomadura bangladeshensis TaxID=453573 RepID=A0A6L9QWS9_9ACTN|nr:hypothetical protein [Actinomadura bangladeshensis]NEA29656.1 hypothetical protein [Actinomadura bangladeshensis]
MRQDELGKPLLNGAAGENPTTAGIVANGVLISEQRRVGRSVLPEGEPPADSLRHLSGPAGRAGLDQAFIAGAYIL